MFTPTESAIVAIFYSLFVGFCLHRELQFKNVLKSLTTTTWITGRVLLILFAATVFGRLLIEQKIPVVVADSLLSLTDNMYLVWALTIMLLLFVGMFMETLAAIMIIVPVLLPIMYMLGADPTHVGIVVVCALSIGFATPPLGGENIFVASGDRGGIIRRADHRSNSSFRYGLGCRCVSYRFLSATITLATVIGGLLTSKMMIISD